MPIQNIMMSEANPEYAAQLMGDIYKERKRKFVIIIDEWDCIFREYKTDYDAQKKYLDFLRDWMKDKAYIGLAYMTGILPIKKYGTHSALNMFAEYSMTNAVPLDPYMGFTTELNDAPFLAGHSTTIFSTKFY